MPLLERAPIDEGHDVARGWKRPRAIAWFGFTAFWGHLRHLIASAIATENIDSRQWMVPDDPDALLERALVVLGAKDPKARTLAAGMGGEVWIDFVADTGDCVTASSAVAKLLVGAYEVPDPDDPSRALRLPRGEVLIHGGDIAYPVATVREVTRRLIEPWNEVLDADRTRLLLGIPGNHDWYDGLDGFARLSQAPCDFEGPRASTPALPSSDEDDQADVLQHPVLAWAEAFARGVAVRKPGALTLKGYVPAQRASYFCLPLARGIDLFGVDRQLKHVDVRQRAYFAQRNRARARLIIVPDPMRAWGELRPNGVATARSLGLDFENEDIFFLAGDVHHYERSRQGRSLHVVAGGGGAFFQGARSAPGGAYAIDAEFPGPRASSALLWRLPIYTATGRSGWLLILACALAVGVGLVEYVTRGVVGALVAGAVTSVLVALATGALVSFRRRSARVSALALLLGVLIGAMPLGVASLIEGWGQALGARGDIVAVPFTIAWAAGTFSSAFLFGAMLVVIARLGLNHAQPYAALGLPGYRHFLRLRVREGEGKSIVDAFVIGCVDPVGGSPPVLVDTFRWSP